MANKHQFDRGWAWAVDAGVFIVIFVLIAWIRIAGLIFMEIQSLTGASTADVAWVNAGNAMSWHFLAPLSAILAAKFGTRKVVALGGIIVSLSTSSGYFIRQLPGFIAMGVFIGAGGAMCFTPSIVFLSNYFRRKFGVATGITSAGSSLSQIIMSPICGYLLEEYALPGTLLIFGGIALHLLISAALFFPVDSEQLKQADNEYRMENMKKDTQGEAMLKNTENYELNEEVIHASSSLVGDDPDKGSVLKNLLKNPNFWILIAGFSVCNMTSVALVKYGPPYCREHGMTISDIGLFLSLSGIPGIIVRLLIGLVSDVNFVKKKLQRYRLFAFGIALTAASCFIFIFTTEYVGFLINFLLMGVSNGVFYTLNSMTAFDLLGQDNYLLGYGLINACTGVIFLMDSLAIGRLRDVTGTFEASFILCGSLTILVSLIMIIFIPFGQRHNKRKAEIDD